MSAFEGSERARDFHFDLHHPQVLFGQVIGERHVEIGEEAQGFGLEGFQSLQQVVAGPVLGSPARVGFGLQFGQLAVEGEAEPDRRPIALDEGLEVIGRKRAGARLAGFVDCEIGRKQHVAHVFGPGFVIELDQAFEFAQDMGVAEGVIDRIEPAIRQEVVMHDDAPLQIHGDRAALFVGAIEGEGQARGRMQPLQLAGDAKSGPRALRPGDGEPSPRPRARR